MKMVNEIRRLCKMQLEEFVELFDNTDLGDRHKKISHDAYERTEEINKMYKEYVKLVRDYLKTLGIHILEVMGVARLVKSVVYFVGEFCIIQICFVCFSYGCKAIHSWVKITFSYISSFLGYLFVVTFMQR